ncbi:MAG: hypothetical protein WC848_02925 [Parcubacteria group bacterium]
METTYASAGVNISAGNLFAEMIKKRVSMAWPEGGNEIGSLVLTYVSLLLCR